MKPSRFKWIEYNHRPLVLYANLEYENGAVTQTGLKSDMLDPVQEWCERTKWGVRVSYDMFKFRDRAEISVFLLKWG